MFVKFVCLHISLFRIFTLLCDVSEVCACLHISLLRIKRAAYLVGTIY